MFDMQKFARFLSKKRSVKNFTQGQLADIMGVSHQAVSKWERGESMPDISKLPELAAALSVSNQAIIDAMHSDAEADTLTVSQADNMDAMYYALPDKTLIGDVYALAPHLSKETLAAAIAEIALSKGSGAAKMLFRFADEQTLKDIAVKVFEVDTDAGRIDFVPYLSATALNKLILNRYASGTVDQALVLLPYCKDAEVVDMVFTAVVSTDGNWDRLKPYINKILPEVVVKQGIEYVVSHGTGCFNCWWGLIGRESIGKIFAGYLKHFNYNLQAWMDVSYYAGNADNDILLQALEHMKAVGADMSVLKKLQARNFSQQFRQKLLEWGIEPPSPPVNNQNQSGKGKDANGINMARKMLGVDELFEELEERIDDLESQIDDLEDQIVSLEDQIESLEDRISELESQLEE